MQGEERVPQGYRMIVNRGQLTQRMLSLKDHTLEQAKEAAQGMVTKTAAQTAEVISRANGQTIVKYVKSEED